MSFVITHIDRTIELLNKHIARYETKGPTHKIPEMVTFYADRARSTRYEIQELEFIRDLVEREHEILRVYQ
jgi:hypothetical protein